MAVGRRPVPPTREVDAFVAAVQDAGVQLIGLNFFAGDMPGGDRGLVSWPARQQEFRDNIDVASASASGSAPGVQRALRQPGRRRRRPRAGRVGDREPASPPAPAVGAFGGTVLVEPVSGAPRYPLLTAADALAVDRPGARRGRRQRRLLADLYHLAVNGDDVDAGDRAIRRPRSATCRSPTPPAAASPAPATLDLDGYLTTLAAAGYDG